LYILHVGVLGYRAIYFNHRKNPSSEKLKGSIAGTLNQFA